MALDYKVIGPDETNSILEFEKKKLVAIETDEMKREMLSWNASWREEALQHYLPLMWSMAGFKDRELKAYFLVQPILFHRADMQSLWVEHISAENVSEVSKMIEIIYKTAREKHIQKVIFSDEYTEFLKDYKGQSSNWVEVFTTKKG